MSKRKQERRKMNKKWMKKEKKNRICNIYVLDKSKIIKYGESIENSNKLENNRSSIDKSNIRSNIRSKAIDSKGNR